MMRGEVNASSKHFREITTVKRKGVSKKILPREKRKLQ